MPLCSICKEKFMPKYSSLEKWCSPPCEHEYKVQLALKAAEKFRKNREKERKKESDAVLNKMKEKQKDAKFYKKILMRVFHTFIKLRDKDDGCISCGTKENIQFAAGHYWTVGSAPALRFNEDNVHKQCNMNCNKSKSGNIVNYRPALIKKIGIERFEALEAQKGIPKKYTVDELKELITLYKQKIKEMK